MVYLIPLFFSFLIKASIFGDIKSGASKIASTAEGAVKSAASNPYISYGASSMLAQRLGFNSSPYMMGGGMFPGFCSWGSGCSYGGSMMGGGYPMGGSMGMMGQGSSMMNGGMNNGSMNSSMGGGNYNGGSGNTGGGYDPSYDDGSGY